MKLSFVLLLVLSCWKSYQYEGKTDQCGRSLVNRIYLPWISYKNPDSDNQAVNSCYVICQRNCHLCQKYREKKIYWCPKNLSFTRTTSCILGDMHTIWCSRVPITYKKKIFTKFFLKRKYSPYSITCPMHT